MVFTTGTGPSKGKEAREKIRRLADAARNGRALGGFWQHMLVAEGAIDAALDWTSKPWDLAPLGIIVEEAGGRSTNTRGERTIYTGDFLSTNGLIHEEALALFAVKRNLVSAPAKSPPKDGGQHERAGTSAKSRSVTQATQRTENAVLPNAWDVASARIVEDLGYPAIATTSAGIAATLGYPDGQKITRDEMLTGGANRKSRARPRHRGRRSRLWRHCRRHDAKS